MSTISLKHISKRFDSHRALDDVSLEIQAGERLALVGENGAGKSSLMNVLYGLYAPDAGDITINGHAVRIRTPADALAHGIGMVHQHFTLVPTLSVVENLILGREPTRRGLIDTGRAREEVSKTCTQFGFSVDLDVPVSSLTVGGRQKVEILKALHRRVSTLILDEPTAVLTPQESHELFAVTRTLSEQGMAIVLISHKLSDVLSFASRIAVMRRGRKVAEVTPDTTDAPSLAQLMVGERTATVTFESCQRGAVAIAVEHLSTEVLADVSFEAHQGELLGIAGIDGSGQQHLAQVLTGLRDFKSGAIKLFGEEVSTLTPKRARELGIAHIPEDRHHIAMIEELSVAENAALGRQRQAPFARGARIDAVGRQARTLELLEKHDIRPRQPNLRMAALSGGNQQKLIVARELDARPRVLLAIQPTRGLDLAAVDDVHRRLLRFRQQGGSVILMSLDLDEILALSDRVLVLWKGRISATFERAAFDAQRIGQHMLGIAHA